MPLSFFFFSFSIPPIFLSVKIISPPLPFFFPSTVRVDFFLSQWGRGESGKAKNNYEILGVCVSFKSYNVFFLPERGQNLKFKKNKFNFGGNVFSLIIKWLSAVWKNLFFNFFPPFPPILIYYITTIHFNIFFLSLQPSSSANTTKH